MGQGDAFGIALDSASTRTLTVRERGRPAGSYRCMRHPQAEARGPGAQGAGGRGGGRLMFIKPPLSRPTSSGRSSAGPAGAWRNTGVQWEEMGMRAAQVPEVRRGRNRPAGLVCSLFSQDDRRESP